ncbi:hypothetical protein FB45DRAFT_1065443 [Roridomyces roridus]|uniref:Uncharacterized protein n=1 Tax=Roridomyces roridus TaxID=1738132 RepID=A0AAD7B898_9AGAR|nr:hypothetical protein FB45DRAFT_1065443 [Roridomyces roridus]
MQSLGNQSRVSLLSWWSDSNPGLNGPTINLHTMTKPLLRAMYHRQALEYIAVNNDNSLSEVMVDIYSSYLECKYVASRTKVRVLSHLSSRAHLDMDAQKIVNSSVFSETPQLLESPNEHIRRESAKLMTTLARSDENPAIVEWAVRALVRIAVWQNDDDAAVENINDRTALSIRPSYLQSEWNGATRMEVMVLQCLRDHMPIFGIGSQNSSTFREILQFLESEDAEIRLKTARLITQSTSHRWIVASTNILNQVVEKLELVPHDEDITIVEEVFDSLTNIAFWLPGAECIVASGVLEYTQELLASTHPGLAIEAARLIAMIAGHYSDRVATIASMIEKLNSFENIVFLLHDMQARASPT